MLPLYLLCPTGPPTPADWQIGPPWIFGPRINPDLYGAWREKKVPFLSIQYLYYKCITKINNSFVTADTMQSQHKMLKPKPLVKICPSLNFSDE